MICQSVAVGELGSWELTRGLGEGVRLLALEKERRVFYFCYRAPMLASHVDSNHNSPFIYSFIHQLSACLVYQI
jgi:hypothetical protein